MVIFELILAGIGAVVIALTILTAAYFAASGLLWLADKALNMLR